MLVRPIPDKQHAKAMGIIRHLNFANAPFPHPYESTIKLEPQSLHHLGNIWGGPWQSIEPFSGAENSGTPKSMDSSP